MTTHLNKSKKLLVDYDKMFQKLWRQEILDQFDEGELVSLEVFGTWRGSLTRGAKSMHRFRLFASRPTGEDAFVDRKQGGFFLLSAKEPLADTLGGGLRPFAIEGYTSDSGRTFLMRSASPLELSERPDLQAKMDELLTEKTYASDVLGELMYDIRYDAFAGELREGEELVSITLQNTGPEEVAEQASKLADFFEHRESVEATCRELLWADAKLRSYAPGPNPALALVRLSLDANRLSASFHAEATGTGHVVAFWQDGQFGNVRVDKFEPPARG